MGGAGVVPTANSFRNELQLALAAEGQSVRWIQMSQGGFDSPEVAAMSTFPAEHAYVVAARTQGDDAYVLLNTGSHEQPYLYGVNCRRRAGRWHESGSGSGPGWEQTADDPDVGTLDVG
jgi:hypothetical protein